MRKAIVAIALAGLLAACGATATTDTTARNGGTNTASKTWQTVTELTGTANKKGDDFHLNGGNARLTYSCKGDMAVLGVYIVESGHDVQTEGGIPEVFTSGSAADTTRITKPAGDYYLDVSAANCKWSVKIEEQR